MKSKQKNSKRSDKYHIRGPASPVRLKYSRYTPQEAIDAIMRVSIRRTVVNKVSGIYGDTYTNDSLFTRIASRIEEAKVTAAQPVEDNKVGLFDRLMLFVKGLFRG
jgi:hypothetical protein